MSAILMYHRVASLAPDPHRLCTPRQRFQLHMERVARAFQPLPLEELARLAEAGTLPARAVAVTLDDGTVDALEAAAILAELRVPATFFINGARLNEPNEAWWDVVVDDPSLRERLLAARSQERARLLAGIERPARPEWRRLLGDEVRRLAGVEGISIGAHGFEHLRLTALPPDERRAELAEGRAALESLLRAPVTSLSYAYGAHDPATVALARELGFSCAVTVEPRAIRAGEDRLRLPRIDAQPLDADSLAQAIA